MHIKTVLITGASRGIGYETSKAVAQKGHRVIAAARTSESLAALKKHLPEKIDVFTADLTSAPDIEKLAAYLDRNGVQLDGIIHNAGLLVSKPFSDLTDNDWWMMMNINLMAPVRLTRRLLGYLNGDCHILNISSMGGYQQSSKFQGLCGYSTSKGAVAVFTECLAVELASQNIQANCLCLGAVQTEMLQEAFPGMKAPVAADEMGRYIADFALEGNKYYNGKILPVALSDPG